MWLLLLVLVVGGGALVAFDAVAAPYVFAPLLAVVILRIGWATFGSLRAGAAHIPDGPARAVDLERERVTYACEGCGAELLLLARGTELAPRHCGERMHVRREVPRDATP